MHPKDALRLVGESSISTDVLAKWDDSMAVYYRDRNGFPMNEDLRQALSYCRLESTLYQELTSTVQEIQRNEALHRLAWHCRWRLFDDPSPSELLGWPLFENALGNRSGMFYMLMGLSMIPYVRNYHKSLSLPENVTRETCQTINSFCESYRLGHDGRPGIQRSRISWLRHYPRQPLFRIDGLEFWLKENPIPFNVFRNRATKHVVALMWGDEYVSDDGYILLEPDEPDAWKTFYEESHSSVTGFPIHPRGRIFKRPVTLSIDKWEKRLGNGEPSLQLHIPLGARLNPRFVSKSLREAVAFFNEYFANETPKAFVGGSWVFSPILESLLGCNSNAVQLQKELYAVSGPPGGSGFSFIFPEDEFKLETATQKTRLQQAIVNLLEQGGKWRAGEMFFLIDDLDRFGTQHYLNEFEHALDFGSD